MDQLTLSGNDITDQLNRIPEHFANLLSRIMKIEAYTYNTSGGFQPSRLKLKGCEQET